jgi:hypothetical protein
MTAATEPVPTLELPSAALMQWSQLALLLAAQLAARRERLDRLAWSNDEHAAREHDFAELREAIEPAVRAMTTDEIAHWPPSDSHRTPGTAGPVSAEVAPIRGVGKAGARKYKRWACACRASPSRASARCSARPGRSAGGGGTSATSVVLVLDGWPHRCS